MAAGGAEILGGAPAMALRFYQRTFRAQKSMLDDLRGRYSASKIANVNITTG